MRSASAELDRDRLWAVSDILFELSLSSCTLRVYTISCCYRQSKLKVSTSAMILYDATWGGRRYSESGDLPFGCGREPRIDCFHLSVAGQVSNETAPSHIGVE